MDESVLRGTASDPRAAGGRAYAWYRALREQLERMPPFKLAIRYLVEVKNDLLDSPDRARRQMDRLFQSKSDPWEFCRPAEQARFARAVEMLDEARAGRRFQSALEIGCAEGMFSPELAARCDSVVCLDVSPVAVAHAVERTRAFANLRFAVADLRMDDLGGGYDLIVATGVLEMIAGRRRLAAIRERLVGALRPGGYLLLGSTVLDSGLDRSWVARHFVRGTYVNDYVAQHPQLRRIREARDHCGKLFAHALLQKLVVRD